MKQLRYAAKQLTTITDLNVAQGQWYHNDMVVQSKLALAGQLNPETHIVEPGVELLCDYIQELAAFNVMPA